MLSSEKLQLKHNLDINKILIIVIMMSLTTNYLVITNIVNSNFNFINNIIKNLILL